MRYFIGFLIVIGIIVLIFVLFLTGGPSAPAKTPTSLSTYADTNIVVQYTNDGPITADQTHRAVQITIGQSEASINIIQGYQDTVINHVSYANNESAYKTFLNAIDLAGFGKTKKTSQTDDSGVCPLGDRHIFEIINGATDLQRTWNTTCSGLGTFGGDSATISDLFQQQIPNYDQLVDNVNIGL